MNFFIKSNTSSPGSNAFSIYIEYASDKGASTKNPIADYRSKCYFKQLKITDSPAYRNMKIGKSPLIERIFYIYNICV